MRFWIREIAGWALVLLGLYVFSLCLGMLDKQDKEGNPTPLILEVGPATLIGVVIFRGGLHLLKVAVAARVCLAANSPPFEERAHGALLGPPPRRSNRPATVERP